MLFLLRLKGTEKACPGAQQAPCAVAAWRLDLVDFSAEIPQDHAAGRLHHHVRQNSITRIPARGKAGGVGRRRGVHRAAFDAWN